MSMYVDKVHILNLDSSTHQTKLVKIGHPRKQDMPDWNEDDYDPANVDQRSEYETRVIAKYKMRPSRTGKYGT